MSTGTPLSPRSCVQACTKDRLEGYGRGLRQWFFPRVEPTNNASAKCVESVRYVERPAEGHKLLNAGERSAQASTDNIASALATDTVESALVNGGREAPAVAWDLLFPRPASPPPQRLRPQIY